MRIVEYVEVAIAVDIADVQYQGLVVVVVYVVVVVIYVIILFLIVYFLLCQL